jgi:mannose-1-phosphate guanylyltransferase
MNCVMSSQPKGIFMDGRKIVNIQDKSRWAVVLAGGDGIRLRSLTRAIAGDERPKQFCALLEDETLLQQTVRRVAGVVRPSRTRVVLTRDHEPYFDSQTKEAETPVIIQPANRGTAPAILYSLLSIESEERHAQVALFPADHYYADDVAFTEHVDLAFQAVARRPGLVILLGVVPTGPEVDYGWIQPGEPLHGVLKGELFRVRRFWEKPSLEVAKDLLAHGWLWNSFVLVGAVHNLLDLIRNSVPKLYRCFETVRPAIGTLAESGVANELYARISSVDFSGQVLSASPRALTVLPVADTGWTDMGNVDRVLSVLESRARQPVEMDQAS